MNINPRIIFFVLFALAASLAIAQPSDNTKSRTASEMVEGLHAELLQVMKDADELGYAGRYQQLQPVIKSNFDLQALAKSSVRGYWDEFTPAQQQRFLEDFQRLSIDTYAQRFDGFNGETFKTLEENAVARGNHQVKTQLIKADGEKISLVYILRPEGQSWRIVNVVAQGVSDLALKRSQYVGVLKKQGVEAFLARIQAQAEALPAFK